jgi:hypothetical protein
VVFTKSTGFFNTLVSSATLLVEFVVYSAISGFADSEYDCSLLGDDCSEGIIVSESGVAGWCTEFYGGTAFVALGFCMALFSSFGFPPVFFLGTVGFRVSFSEGSASFLDVFVSSFTFSFSFCELVSGILGDFPIVSALSCLLVPLVSLCTFPARC